MSRAQIRTLAPDGSNIRYLGALGPVGGVRYSFTVPGGCDQLSATVGIPPTERTDALNPGRLVDAWLGGDSVWNGILTEPEPAPEGWNLTAIGSGNQGANWRATFSGAWASSVPDATINNAEGRGLAWQTSAIGSPATLFKGQAADSGAQAIDEMLNQITSKGTLTWQVKHTPGGDIPQVFAVPTVANRLLVATAPAARTLGGDINAICVRYQSAPDLGNKFPATYATTYRTDPASIAAHGRQETFLDLSSVGPMLLADAQAVATGILTRYQRASWGGPFTVTPGQLLTLGGQPVDLGVYYGPEQAMVCKLLLTDEGWGGEVALSTPVFAVGRYEYDDDSNTAVIEPFNSLRGDFSALTDERAGLAHARRIIRRWHDGHTQWRFAGTSKWHQGPKAKRPRHKARPPHDIGGRGWGGGGHRARPPHDIGGRGW